MTDVVFTGTATNYSDLLDKVLAHLTHASMGSEAWTISGDDTTSVAGERFVYLVGPGLSGTDSIHVNLRLYQSVGSDYYNWQIRGSVAYNPILSWANQPGTSPPATFPLWQSSIPYWLVANGRHFKIIAKVSTTYQSMYGGFYLPYATSSEMPYPMYIGASGSTAAQRWSAGDYSLGSFWDPADGGCFVRHFDGAWTQVRNYQSSGFNYRSEIHDYCIWPFESDINMGSNQDGSYSIFPTILHSQYSGGNVYGVLDGVFYISGFGNAAENTVTIGSDEYLVVQSADRTSRRDYAAIKIG